MDWNGRHGMADVTSGGISSHACLQILARMFLQLKVGDARDGVGADVIHARRVLAGLRTSTSGAFRRTDPAPTVDTSVATHMSSPFCPFVVRGGETLEMVATPYY